MRLIDAAAADVSPSTGVSTSENIKAAYNAVHAGRPALNYGPPTSIFSPQLARLSDRLQNLHSVEPSALYLKHSHEYIVHATDFYGKEMDRETNLKTTIDDILGAEGQWQHQFANKKAKPDATWGMPIYIVYEGKNENGQGDASLQGILVYRKMLTLPDYRAVMQYSNCPIILIGTMANRLEISAAIFTDGIYADKLVSLDLLLGFDGEENVLRLARILHVLAISAQEICAHYEEARNNPPSDLIAVVLPDPTPVLGETLPKMTFKSKLSRSNKALDIVKTDAERCHGLYLATMPQPPPVGSNPSSEALREVVVKFTKRYNPEAHRLLAAEGLAPALHACSQVLGGLYMVVMDRIRDGQPLELCRNRISQTVYDDVKKAMSLLHAENIVFGDLRLPNIMLLPSGRAMLVDFDWADADGKGRYSSMLNDSLVDHWAPGVQRRAIMTKEHDIFMLERLKDAANMLMPRSGAMV
ncbi:uncharacterized protein LAESUDRAFT_650178 [Laetiporus sulphureus 93-53]|uniref:Protein kinase domain-containing protein n=1 Tax=Laetiporus sulphureus 93-53 TaxID=1314785 RepID=A0A165EW43_9APHY|nr:uncharacterized protein LAESUDRAFT_650178 [Laetiporus sulphureus 93-53]KZT07892.1 hypothetical protein LAESUDRAFT_650178 [Laetiporus sulphureus 93-53]